MRDSGGFNDEDLIRHMCLQFCFMSVIQKDLDSIRIRWNSHKIRATRHQECPSGKPDVLYHLPDIYGVEDYKLPFDDHLLEMLHPLKREKILLAATESLRTYFVC